MEKLKEKDQLLFLEDPLVHQEFLTQFAEEWGFCEEAQLMIINFLGTFTLLKLRKYETMFNLLLTHVRRWRLTDKAEVALIELWAKEERVFFFQKTGADEAYRILNTYLRWQKDLCDEAKEKFEELAVHSVKAYELLKFLD